MSLWWGYTVVGLGAKLTAPGGATGFLTTRTAATLPLAVQGRYIGLTVMYRVRHGEGRSGRVEFPSLVLPVRPGDVLELLVIYGPEDFKEVVAPRASNENPRGAWDFIGGDALDRVAALEQQVAALTAKFAEGRNGRK